MADTLAEVIAAAAMLLGSGLLLLAAVGLIRMPDLMTRLSAATKAVTLGASLMFVGVMFSIPEAGVQWRAGAGIFFFFLTAPIAAHVLARAAYFVGTPLWRGTIVDELAEVSHQREEARSRAARRAAGRGEEL